MERGTQACVLSAAVAATRPFFTHNSDAPQNTTYCLWRSPYFDDRPLFNLKFHYIIHTWPSLQSKVSQINPVHTFIEI
jgi:hypothetical protein